MLSISQFSNNMSFTHSKYNLSILQSLIRKAFLGDEEGYKSDPLNIEFDIQQKSDPPELS